MGQKLKTIYYVTVMILFTIVMFIIFGLIWLVTVPFDKNREVSHHVSRFWSRVIYGFSPWWKVKVSGMEHIKKGQPYIVVSNHQSTLDIPLLYVLSFNFKWVSKREVYKIPFFGWVLWMHGDVAIERGGVASARKMMADCEKYLDRGVSVIMFPEGTRTKTGHVNNFKEGAMTLAVQSGYPILPVVIDGTFDAFKGGRIAAPHTFQVKVLPPVNSDQITKSTPKELRDTLQQLMSRTHREMVPHRYENEE